MTNKTIGENLRALRENAGFTQCSIANFMKVDQSFVARLEKGERSLSADMLEKLAALFGVTVDQMESQTMVTSKLSFAFRGSELSMEEMEAISAINRIALSSEFMRSLLKGAGV
ncbi:MAG: helix-turn-helix transcriptional regulator [Lachnospiraceae bacterium]|nr:helix-turn-helix transcriptional regulator [Lachnospiraceae bacterium]